MGNTLYFSIIMYNIPFQTSISTIYETIHYTNSNALTVNRDISLHALQGNGGQGSLLCIPYNNRSWNIRPVRITSVPI